MLSQTESIYSKGMDALVAALGVVGMETFISLIRTDDFNYIAWRDEYFKDVTFDDIEKGAAELENNFVFAPNAKRI